MKSAKLVIRSDGPKPKLPTLPPSPRSATPFAFRVAAVVNVAQQLQAAALQLLAFVDDNEHVPVPPHVGHDCGEPLGDVVYSCERAAEQIKRIGEILDGIYPVFGQIEGSEDVLSANEAWAVEFVVASARERLNAQAEEIKKIGADAEKVRLALPRWMGRASATAPTKKRAQRKQS